MTISGPRPASPGRADLIRNLPLTTNRLKANASPATRAAGFSELAIGGAGAETASALDWDNRDTFDRMLVAHCHNHDLALVTADARLRARNDVVVMWVG